MDKLMQAIVLRDVTKTFKGFKAVDSLNLEVKVGEIFGLLGPNGAGKTTTIRMICGLMEPTRGEIRVFGYQMPKERFKAIRIMGYMAQRFSLYEDLTVIENLNFYGALYGLSREERESRIKELLEFLELSHVANRLAGKLSGGMKQRLALAAALIHKPKLLILDEPTAGVDPPIRRAFWRYLRELNKEGVTILVTTHYMDEAENCDRLGLMSRGRLLAVGSPRELKRLVYGGDLLELAVQGVGNPVGAVKGLPYVRSVDFNNGKLRVVVDDAEVNMVSLVNRLVEEGFKVTSAVQVNLSLEDAFIKLVEAHEP